MPQAGQTAFYGFKSRVILRGWEDDPRPGRSCASAYGLHVVAAASASGAGFGVSPGVGVFGIFVTLASVQS